MNLTGHIMLNDLRRLRRPLALWVALLMAKLGLGAVLLWGGTGSGAWFDRIDGAIILLGAIEVLMGYVLVAWLIHGDMPTGTTAFWMTRPMSGTRLLAAKLLGLAVIFGAAPLLLTLPWWLACGYGPRELMLAAGETLFLHGVVVAFALPLAALTDEFSRYLMWTLVLITALVGASLTMVVVPTMGRGASANAGLIATRGWLALALFLIGGSVAAVQQFWARRLLRSFATLGAGVVVALATLNYWPVDLSRKSSALVDRPGRHAAGFSLALQSARTFEPPGADAELTVSLKLDGAPPELVLNGMSVDHQWRWAGGAVVERAGWWDFGTWGNGPAMHMLGIAPQKPNAEYEAYLADRRRQRGLPALSESERRRQLGRSALPESERGVRTTRVKLPPSIAARMRREPPACLLRAHFSLHRPEVVDERPPRAGERLARDAEHARLARVDRRDDRLIVAVVEQRPLVLGGADRLNALNAFLGGRRPLESQYFLVNRGRGNASQISWLGWNAVRVGTVGIRWRTMAFFTPRDYRGEGNWVAHPGWFDGVTLAKVVLREEERFTTELRVERFEVVKVAAKEGAR